MQVYVDESGGKGHSNYFVMAGLISHSENWGCFSREWSDCLKESPSINRFKMKQAAKLNGPFGRLSAEQRDKKLRALARVINTHVSRVIRTGMELNDHAKTWGKDLPKPHSDPYFYCFQAMVSGACFDIWDSGCREPFEIIFDEHVVFGTRVEKWFPVFREIMRAKHPDEFSILPDLPTFRSDDECMPIQAVDIFAYIYRASEELKGANTGFEWMATELGSLRCSEYCRHFELEDMRSIYADSQLARNSTLIRGLLQRREELLGGK